MTHDPSQRMTKPWPMMSRDERRAALEPLCERGLSYDEIAAELRMSGGSLAGFLGVNTDLRDLRSRRCSARPDRVATKQARDARLDRILDLWRNGATSPEIASVVGLTKDAVRTIVRRARLAGDPRAVHKMDPQPWRRHRRLGAPGHADALSRAPAAAVPLDRLADEIADRHASRTDAPEWRGMRDFAMARLAAAAIGYAGTIPDLPTVVGTATAAVPAEGEAAVLCVVASPAQDTVVHPAGAAADPAVTPPPQPDQAEKPWALMTSAEKKAAVAALRPSHTAMRIAERLGAPSKNAVCGVLARIADAERGADRPKRKHRRAEPNGPARPAVTVAPVAVTRPAASLAPLLVSARPVARRTKSAVVISPPRLPAFAIPGAEPETPRATASGLPVAAFDAEARSAILAAYRAGEPVAVIAARFGCREDVPAEISRQARAAAKRPAPEMTSKTTIAVPNRNSPGSSGPSTRPVSVAAVPVSPAPAELPVPLTHYLAIFDDAGRLIGGERFGGTAAAVAALGTAQCRWPTGMPGSDGFSFCCAPVTDPAGEPVYGQSYCATHRGLAYGRGTPSERGAVKAALRVSGEAA